MSDGYRPPAKEKNVFSHPKLHLKAPCPTPAGKGKFSSLRWEVYENNPRMIVYTNCPEDTGESNEYGKISANVDSQIFFSLMVLIKRAVDMPTPAEPTFFIMDNKKAGWDRQANRPSDPYVISSTFIGKDPDGRVWISVKSKKKERPVVKFYFKLSEFHDIRNQDGSPADEGMKSCIAAEAYMRMMSELMPAFLNDHYVEPKPKEDRNGGGGYNRSNNGGGNNYNRGGNSGGNGGGNSGGRTNNFADADDDIPF